jgi:hypothetical protein
MNFIVELAGKIQLAGIKKKLTSLRSYHVDSGFPLNVFKDDQLERVLRGIKWTTFPALGNTPDQTPLTRDLLHRFHQQVDPKTHSGATICAAFILAFAAFLHSGEFTYTATDVESLEYPFQQWHITWSSITFPPNGFFMYLNLPASKTDPFWQGVTITISHDIENIFCPVRTMIHYLLHFPPKDMSSPLFSRQDNSPFTREYIVSVLQDLAIHTGERGHFTGHSFWRGAATWATL